MIRQVIFDFFGVLTEDGWLTFLRQYEDKDIAEELRYINHQFDRGAMSYDDFITQAATLTGVDKVIVDSIVAKQHHPNRDLFKYIEGLKERGFLVGIISNVGSQLEDFLPEQSFSVFDTITLSYELGAAKPDPLIFEKHLEKSGCSPEEVIFVDDRQVNCEGAMMVGMQAVLHKNVEQTIRELDGLLS